MMGFESYRLNSISKSFPLKHNEAQRSTLQKARCLILWVAKYANLNCAAHQHLFAKTGAETLLLRMLASALNNYVWPGTSLKHSDKFNFPWTRRIRGRGRKKKNNISLMRTETARSSNKEKPARWRTGCTNRTHNLSASPSKPLTAAITSLAHSHSEALQLPAHPSLVFPANLGDRVTWPPSRPSVGSCWPPGDLPVWGCMANRGLAEPL